MLKTGISQNYDFADEYFIETRAGEIKEVGDEFGATHTTLWDQIADAMWMDYQCVLAEHS